MYLTPRSLVCHDAWDRVVKVEQKHDGKVSFTASFRKEVASEWVLKFRVNLEEKTFQAMDSL